MLKICGEMLLIVNDIVDVQLFMVKNFCVVVVQGNELIFRVYKVIRFNLKIFGFI